MVTPTPGDALRDAMGSDDAIPAACWVSGRIFAGDEPRLLIPLAPNTRHDPPFEGHACLGCYHGRQQGDAPGAAEGRPTSRVLLIPGLEFAS